MIRRLLTDTNPGVQLPAATEVADDTPDVSAITPETYLGWSKVQNYGGTETYTGGETQFSYPDHQPADTFAVDGDANVETQYIEAAGDQVKIRLTYSAAEVRMVLAGTGTITADVDGETRRIDVSGTPDSYEITKTDQTKVGTIEITLPAGVKAYSFTFGGQ